MSSKKTKLLESAQKNILKGQLDRAIAEYRQIIALDPSDLRHRQKIAEILTKAKLNNEAVIEYTFIAKHYIDSIHYLKAIAVYKQIQKLDPLNPDIALTLASLNEKQGLIGNAVSEYAAAVQIFEKNGENLKALKALESIMTLDADNAAVKLRIAEKYFKTGSEDISFEIFTALLNELKERNDENGFSLIAERADNLFGDRFQTFMAQSAATDSSEVQQNELALLASQNIKDTPVNIPGTSEYSSAPAPLDEHNEERADSAAFEEIEYIEDILPLEDDENNDHATFTENIDEWEEEIEFPSHDSPPESLVEQDVAQEVLEELDAFDELAEIEIEMEIDDEPSEEPTTFDDTLFSEPDEAFDLGRDLSMFADEIDFDLLTGQGQDTAFDISNSGFKKGELDNEDAESHYSLGLAYKEMGLWDEAIAEFIVASRSSERKIDALILEGVCLRETGNVAKAVEILADTLKDEKLTEDERLGIQYELALCHEASGEIEMARSMLTDIIAARPAFSDVAARLHNLPI